MKLGITGLAQVNGRNAISWKQRFEFDVYYVDHLSLALDLQIEFITIRKILIGEGVNYSDNRPMNSYYRNN